MTSSSWGSRTRATTSTPSSGATTRSTSSSGTTTTSPSSTGGCPARRASTSSPGRAGTTSPTALLMLTARDAPPDRIQGLDAGRRRLPRQAVRLRRAAGAGPRAAAPAARRRRAGPRAGPGRRSIPSGARSRSTARPLGLTVDRVPDPRAPDARARRRSWTARRSPSTPGRTRPTRSARTRSTSSSAGCAPSCRRPGSGSSPSAAPAIGWRKHDRPAAPSRPRRQLDPRRPCGDRGRGDRVPDRVASPSSPSSTQRPDRRRSTSASRRVADPHRPGPAAAGRTGHGYGAPADRPVRSRPCSSGRSRRTARVARQRPTRGPARPYLAHVTGPRPPPSTTHRFRVHGRAGGRRLRRRRRRRLDAVDRRAIDDHPGRAAHRADPAPHRVPRRRGHRPAGRRADRGPRASASSSSRPTPRTSCGPRCRSSRRTRQPGPDAGPRRRVVPHGVRPGRPREQADAPAARRPAVARAVRRDRRAAGRRAGRHRRAGGPGRRPLRGRRRGAAASRSGSTAPTAPRRSPRRRNGSTGCSASCSTTPASTRPTAARSTCTVAPEGGRVRLTVDDSGPGIPRRGARAHLRPVPPRRRDVEAGAAPASASPSRTRSFARPVAAGASAARRPVAPACRSAGRARSRARASPPRRRSPPTGSSGGRPTDGPATGRRTARAVRRSPNGATDARRRSLQSSTWRRFSFVLIGIASTAAYVVLYAVLRGVTVGVAANGDRPPRDRRSATRRPTAR